MTITTTDVLRAMKVVVDQHGAKTTDRGFSLKSTLRTKDTACAYTYEDGRHCFTGHVLLELGVDLPSENSWLNCRGVLTLLDSERHLVEPMAMAVLSQGQSMNDDGQPWGDILSDCVGMVMGVGV